MFRAAVLRLEIDDDGTVSSISKGHFGEIRRDAPVMCAFDMAILRVKFLV